MLSGKNSIAFTPIGELNLKILEIYNWYKKMTVGEFFYSNNFSLSLIYEIEVFH